MSNINENKDIDESKVNEKRTDRTEEPLNMDATYTPADINSGKGSRKMDSTLDDPSDSNSGKLDRFYSIS